MSPKLRIFILTIPFVLCNVVAMGQDKGGPPAPNKTIDPPVGLLVPVDESIIYLILAGIALGLIFFLKYRKEQQA